MSCSAPDSLPGCPLLITALIRLQAELFLYKSTLNLGKFEAAEGVLAYSRVFLIKKISQQNKTATNELTSRAK